MKVIMIGSNLRVPGGITRVVKNYIQAGIGDKVEFEYFPTYYGSNNLVNILYFIIQYIRLLFKLYLFNNKYDVAHIHMSYKGSFIRKRHIINLLKKKNIPIILHMHGSQFKEYYNNSSNNRKRKVKSTLNNARVILALGDEWKDYYKTICDTKVISLDNAVFPKSISPNNEEKVYITTMGVLSKRKGTYDLIKVGNYLKDKIDRKYKFVLAGNGEVEKVKNEIKRLGLNDLFIIPGWISDQDKIDEIYRKSIIYVLPSYNEGMPMSILEAMSYGLPIISTKVGSIPSVVKDGNGFLINAGDIEDLGNKILTLLNNEKHLEKMRINNIKKIEEDYNIYNSLTKLVLLYESISNS